jgi:hypothetical protein
MNKRTVLILLAWALCLGTVFGVLLQRQELLGLRAQQEQMAANATQAPQASPLSVNSREISKTDVPSTDSVSRELLRLRSEVTRLNARKRELAAVTEDGERLRAQLAGSQANPQTGVRLPPGYMRKGEAQLMGYSTPENTVQSFLWALQHHDITNVLRALSPSEAQSLSARIGSSSEMEKGYFKSMDSLPGLAIQSRQDLPDGSVELQVEFGLGAPPEKFHLQPFNGEWKLETRL